MSKITGIGMKDCLSLLSLVWNVFISLRLKNTEPQYTYTDNFVRHFLRQCVRM